MNRWIRVEKKSHAGGFRVALTAHPDVMIADEMYFFELEEEADEAHQRALLYAEELLKQSRVDEILEAVEPAASEVAE